MGQRGRKKGASGEESRALLLQIAAEEFANKGYHETKISNIVKRANLTQPTFYLYFRSKEDVFQELVDLFRNKLFELITDSRLEEGLALQTIPKVITHKLAAIFTFFKENKKLTMIGLFISSKKEDIKVQLTNQIAQNLISEQQNHYFNQKMDMGLVAEILLGIIERLTITELFQERKEPEALASEIVNVLLYGIINQDGR